MLQWRITIHLLIVSYIDYDPVRFIYPEKDISLVLVYDNIESKLIECKITGSLQSSMSWYRDNKSLESDVVKRIHIVDASTDPPPYVLQLNLISPIPYLDNGKYTCVVENEWEVVSQSVTVSFELLRGGKQQYLYNVSESKYEFLLQSHLL